MGNKRLFFHLYGSYHLGNAKVLELCARNRMKTKLYIYIFIINHNITVLILIFLTLFLEVLSFTLI